MTVHFYRLIIFSVRVCVCFGRDFIIQEAREDPLFCRIILFCSGKCSFFVRLYLPWKFWSIMEDRIYKETKL